MPNWNYQYPSMPPRTMMRVTPVPHSRAVTLLILAQDDSSEDDPLSEIQRRMQEKRWKLQRRIKDKQDEQAMKKAVKAAAKKMQIDALAEYWTCTEREVLANKEQWERQQRLRKLNLKLAKQHSMPVLPVSSSAMKSAKKKSARLGASISGGLMSSSPSSTSSRRKSLSRSNSKKNRRSSLGGSRRNSSSNLRLNKKDSSSPSRKQLRKAKSTSKLLSNSNHSIEEESPCYDWSTSCYDWKKQSSSTKMLREDSISTAATEQLSLYDWSVAEQAALDMESDLNDSLTMMDLLSATDVVLPSSSNSKKQRRHTTTSAMLHQSMPAVLATAWEEHELDPELELNGSGSDLSITLETPEEAPDFFDWETNHQSFNWESYGAFLHGDKPTSNAATATEITAGA